MKKGKGRNNGLLPNSLRIISSCLKTVSTNASTVASTVRSAGASVAASISSASEDHKDQVTWAGFDRLYLGPYNFKCVLLLGYLNGFQVLDVDDASNFSEVVSKRDGPVSFLQMQPCPAVSDGQEGFAKYHPMLLVVSGDETNTLIQNRPHLSGFAKDGNVEYQSGSCVNSHTAVRFFSLKSHSYIHVLRFRSMVCMIRCSPRIVAVGLATQIYCFDANTLENKFSVLTHPVPQLAGQGTVGVNVGYGPMAVGSRWLAYASNNPLPSNSGRLSPQNLTPSPGVSPSTSPSSGNLVARYAMESSKHLAVGLINLGDMGYKTLSKYCQELLPDGSSSPVPSNSGWKVGRVGGTENDYTGMVVVKDFVSRTVISQFKAHTSPISALCFDPSGTLLVTASVYGNNINIFRIMPSSARKMSGILGHDWSSSHVHLYKLHRGITSAVIQDICFSHFSQWIAIVSSKGTCHIFVLSPFGGDPSFRVISSHGDESSLFPVLSLPWWSTSVCMFDQQPVPPPAPIVLSVVSRIKYSSFGWLNTVQNSPANAAGKVFVPSGALAAVFHNSLSKSQQPINSNVKFLEHLLVYTPSGHVVQHELLPSVVTEPSEHGSRPQSASFMHTQEDELRVKVEPIQWWDVCRRSEWPEREDFNCSVSDRQDNKKSLEDKLDYVDNCGLDVLDIENGIEEEKITKTSCGKPHERSHWYLSNAEVYINFGRLPIWQKSKISFYVMGSERTNYVGGECEIEKVPANEVEIRQKELLPVFDHFHSIKPSWKDRGLDGETYTNSTSLLSHQTEYKITAEETVICHSKPASLSSTESSDGGSSRRIENFLDLDQVACCYPILNEIYQERRAIVDTEPSSQNHMLLKDPLSESEPLKHVDSQVNHCISGEGKIAPLEKDMTGELPSLRGGVVNEDQYRPITSSVVEVPSTKSHLADAGHIFREEHHKEPPLPACHELTEVTADDVDSSSSQNDKEKLEEDGEDEMLGGMFF